MPIKGAVIKEGSTFTPSGGTDATYQTVPSTGYGTLTAKIAETDYRIRPSSLFTSKAPNMGSDGVYGKGRFSAVHRRPIIDTAGKVYMPLVRLDVEWHPLQSAAQVAALWEWLAHLATDADYANFRATGSLD